MKDVVSGSSLSSEDLTVTFSPFTVEGAATDWFPMGSQGVSSAHSLHENWCTVFLMRMDPHLVIDLGESGKSERRLGFVAAL